MRQPTRNIMFSFYRILSSQVAFSISLWFLFLIEWRVTDAKSFCQNYHKLCWTSLELIDAGPEPNFFRRYSMKFHYEVPLYSLRFVSCLTALRYLSQLGYSAHLLPCFNFFAYLYVCMYNKTLQNKVTLCLKLPGRIIESQQSC